MNLRDSLRPTTRAAIAMAVAVVLLSQGCQCGAQTDEQRLQGTWAIVTLEAQGKEFSHDPSDKDRLHWTFSGNKLHTKSSDVERELTFQLDPQRSPKHIDAIFDSENQYRGIYELNGDELKVCQVHIHIGVDRPTEFNAKDRGVLLNFRRVKPSD